MHIIDPFQDRTPRVCKAASYQSGWGLERARAAALLEPGRAPEPGPVFDRTAAAAQPTARHSDTAHQSPRGLGARRSPLRRVGAADLAEGLLADLEAAAGAAEPQGEPLHCGVTRAVAAEGLLEGAKVGEVLLVLDDEAACQQLGLSEKEEEAGSCG